jgi:predicted nucleotidyltransferase
MRPQILAALDGLPVIAAFIYGSVAHETATGDSDIDVFVIVEQELSDDRLSELRLRFVDLQRRLGYNPDTTFPVEVFAAAAVRTALATTVPDEDQQEIRRALADRKIMLTGSLEHLS